MIVDILSNIYKVKLINLINKILPSVFWIFCFLPINLNPENFNEYAIIDQIRLVIPFLLLLIFFIYKFEIKKHFLLNENFFNFVSFITYFVLAVFFIFLNFKLNSYLNIYWGIAMLISYLHIYLFANEIRQLKVFLTISLILLFFIFFSFIATIFLTIIKAQQIIHLYGITGPDSYLHYLSDYPPRSSGLARMSLILNIALTIYLMKSKKNFLKKNILTILIILFGFFVLSFQSRTVTFSYFISIIMFIIIFCKKKFMPYKKNFILIIIMPTLLSIIYLSYSTTFEITKDSSYMRKHDNISNPAVVEIKNKVKNLLLRNTYKQDNFSSHRFDNWKTIVKSSQENFFNGFGFQSDRKIIKQSVHNVYLYALICGGIIGMFLIFLISCRAAWTSLIILFHYIFLRKNYDTIDLISIFLTIVFLQRGLLETSYGVYSIDYLFFIICLFINENNYKKRLET
jgi:hypothetical protein